MFIYGVHLEKKTNDEDFEHAMELSSRSDIILSVGGLDESFEEEHTYHNNLMK